MNLDSQNQFLNKYFYSLLFFSSTGTAHCANMYPSSKDDIPELVKARKQIGTLIGKWLMN